MCNLAIYPKMRTLSIMEKTDHHEIQEDAKYQIYETEWQGIGIEVRHCASWLSKSVELVVQHVEVYSADKTVLPITDTGYRSCFLTGANALDDFDDDPVAFVLWWLDEAAKSKEWKEQMEADRQYSLF